MQQSTNVETAIYEEPATQYLELGAVSENNHFYSQLQNRKNVDNVNNIISATKQTWCLFTFTVLLVAVASAALTYVTIYFTNFIDVKQMDNTSVSYKDIKDITIKNGTTATTHSKDIKQMDNTSVCYTDIKHITRTASTLSFSNLRFPKIVSYCPDDWIMHNTACYKLFSTRKVWQEARYTCLSIETDLLSIQNNEENRFVANTFKSTLQWTGLNDITSEGEFVWSDGSPYIFSNWRSNEPNNYRGREDCMVISSGSGTWNDRNCLTSSEFICKMMRTLICGSGKWNFFNGSCYDVTHKAIEALSWNEARINCTAREADLAVIHSVEEHSFVTSLLVESHLHSEVNTWWIGLSGDFNAWKWVDGSQPNILIWANKRPIWKNACIGILNIAIGEWIDKSCSSKYGFICEKKL